MARVAAIYMLRVAIDGIGDVLFCHATPRNDSEIFTRLTSEDRLRPVQAKDFAARFVLQPSSEEKVLEAYSRAELT